MTIPINQKIPLEPFHNYKKANPPLSVLISFISSNLKEITIYRIKFNIYGYVLNWLFINLDFLLPLIYRICRGKSITILFI